MQVGQKVFAFKDLLQRIKKTGIYGLIYFSGTKNDLNLEQVFNTDGSRFDKKKYIFAGL